MKTVCKKDMCTGCMACINMCPKGAITIRDNIESYNAVIDAEKCISCGLCTRACPNITVRPSYIPIYSKQGWSNDIIRNHSSSGGAASAIALSFVSSGGYVASCRFEHGEFGFSITNDPKIVKQYAGSKYVKSNPGRIYREILDYLKKGKKVLFIGLPCQCAAVQNVCSNDDNLYTIDLICHGTPSPKILKQFLLECGYSWNNIQDIKFRNKDCFGVSENGVRITPHRVKDSYTRAFLHSIDYTENCYFCRYASLERVSDITLGDAWGQLSETEPKGVSLILCQTRKGIDLVEHAGLHLETVDLEKAVKANHQLQHPSAKHKGRSRFLSRIKNGSSIRTAMLVVLPKESIMQSIKTGLIKMKIIKDNYGGGVLYNSNASER